MVFVLHFSLLLYKIYRWTPRYSHSSCYYIYMVIITFTIYKLIVLIVIIWDILYYYWSLTDWLDANLGVQKTVNVLIKKRKKENGECGRGCFLWTPKLYYIILEKKMERKICQKFKQPFFIPYQFIFSIFYLKFKD